MSRTGYFLKGGTVRRAILFFSLASLVGCYFDASYEDRSDLSWAPYDDTASDEGEGQDTGNTDAAVAQYWSLDGNIEIVGGTIVPGESTVTVGSWSSTGALCSVNRPIESVEPTELRDDEIALAGWWIIDLGEPDSDECTVDVPRQLGIGIGGLDSQLFPAMAAAGLDPELDLNGLYVRRGLDESVYIFGVAGTEDQFDGEVQDDILTLTDGTYRLQTLYLLPL